MKRTFEEVDAPATEIGPLRQIDGITWTPDCIDAHTALKERKNLAICGVAGTGKSTLLRELIALCVEFYGKDRVLVTGSTGVAAINVEGKTVHSVFGIGNSSLSLDETVRRVPRRCRKEIRDAAVLFLDEISMIGGDTLEKIHLIACANRHSNDPFGGLLVVVCGDFGQLAPIPERGTPYLESEKVSNEMLAFRSRTWENARFEVISMERSFRQNDRAFVAQLLSIRNNGAGEDVRTMLRTISTPFQQRGIPFPKDVCYLFPRNADADKHNQKQLKLLPASGRTYVASYTGTNEATDALRRACPVDATISLRVGARVIIRVNMLHRGIVNGSTGEITALRPELVLVRLDATDLVVGISPHKWIFKEDGKEIASMSQMPLSFGWAVTVHRSQGLTLANVVLDGDHIRSQSMLYVALSRVRSINGIYLTMKKDVMSLLYLPPNVGARDFGVVAAQALEKRLQVRWRANGIIQ